MIFGRKKNANAIGERRPSTIKRLLMFSLPILVLFAAIFGVIQMGKLKPEPETKTEGPRTAPVLTATASSRTLSLSVNSQGEARPRTEINLSTQVSGKITYISPNFIEGGHFKKNDVLLRLEAADYNLRVTQAQANVAQAQTALTRELSEAQIAQRDWQDLGEGEASPLTLRVPQGAEARARLAANQAALDEAKLNQSRTVLRAAFDGRISQKTASLGEFITTGQAIGRVYSIDRMEVRLPLTDSDLAKLGLGIGFIATASKPGPEVIFSAIIAGKSHSWRGALVRTSSGYDPQTRVLFAYAQLDDPYGKGTDDGVPMASGLFVDAQIVGRNIEQGVIVPRTALRGTDRVFIANSNKTLSIRTVNVVSSTRDQVVITQGLAPGEQVITSPVRGVVEGMKIEVAKSASDLDAAIAVSKEN